VKGGGREVKLRRKTRNNKDKQVKERKQKRKSMILEERWKGIR
jgi:hypothetical protein